MWTHQHTPDAWKWKWLYPIPKGTSEKISDMRPIMLMEVLQKLWTGLIVQCITLSLQEHGALSLNQHGFLPKRGTDTANFNSSTHWKLRGMSSALCTAVRGI